MTCARPQTARALLVAALCAAAQATAAPAAADPGAPAPRAGILDAMGQELRRSQRLRLAGHEPPYYVSLQVTESKRHLMAARFGALVVDAAALSRQAFVDLRVGDYSSDSSGVDATDYERYVAYSPDEALPLDDDAPAALRGALWLLAEDRYKAALSAYLRKRGQAVYAAKEEETPDFSREEPIVHLEALSELQPDLDLWRGRLRELSARLRREPLVFDSQVRFAVERQRRWQVTSEGSRVSSESPLYSLQLQALTRAPDGMLLELGDTHYARDERGLPDDDQLRREVDALQRQLLALREAPLGEPYVGPAILAPEPAGVLFHEAIGHRLEGQRQREDNEGQTFRGRLGQRILPEFLDVLDDPLLEDWEGQSLNGHYEVDDEAVRARAVTLVEAGVLRAFLMSRAPVEGQPRSNGHGRAQPGMAPVGRMGNLIVRSRVSVPLAELERRLMAEVQRQGKPYGLIIEDLSGGSTNTSSQGFQAFKGKSRLVWRVDAATGARSLMRGVEIVGTPLTSVAKVLATSQETGVFNGYCGAESGAVPVSVVAPAILVEEIEQQRAARDEDRSPLLPPPWQDPAAAPPP